MSLCHFRESDSGGELLVVLLDAVRPRPVEGLRLDEVDPLVGGGGVAVDAQRTEGACAIWGKLDKQKSLKFIMISEEDYVIV